MTEINYWDRAGQPISLETATRLVCDRDYRIVARSTIRKPETCFREGVMISTMWLGLNFNPDADGPPLIFETRVFFDRDETNDQTYHTSTETEALWTHHHLVELIRRQLGVSL